MGASSCPPLMVFHGCAACSLPRALPLSGPLADTRFAAHMAQDMLLIGTAVPLIAASRRVLARMKRRPVLARSVVAFGGWAYAFVLHRVTTRARPAALRLKWSWASGCYNTGATTFSAALLVSGRRRRERP
jgi:hypothetical protein